MGRLPPFETFRRAYVEAKMARRSQFTVPGDVAIAYLAHDPLTLRHVLLTGQGYTLSSVPCRLLVGPGLSMVFTYRHQDPAQLTEVLRFTMRQRRKRRAKGRRR